VEDSVSSQSHLEIPDRRKASSGEAQWVRADPHEATDGNVPLEASGSPAEADTRSRILIAAGPVFAARGFDGATVREICKAAGVNVASVGYYFGDKLGLYRTVIEGIREARERRFPVPDHDQADPRQTLYLIVRTMLSRMLACNSTSWETQLMMREMNHPTPVFERIIEEFFRPLFDRLVQTMDRLSASPMPPHVLEQLALSAVGQCLYYCVGSGVVQTLIPQDRREQHYDTESLARHVTSVMLSSVENNAVMRQRQQIDRDLSRPEHA